MVTTSGGVKYSKKEPTAQSNMGNADDALKEMARGEKEVSLSSTMGALSDSDVQRIAKALTTNKTLVRLW